jgi:hypothetical protein
MGSASALVIGPDVEAQLAPYEASDEDSDGFYYFWYEIGPRRYESWTDWSEAFRLKPGSQGEPRYLHGDEPPGLAYSANKGAFDFDGMRREIGVGAGAVWDFARKHGLAGTHEERSSPWERKGRRRSANRWVHFSKQHFPTCIVTSWRTPGLSIESVCITLENDTSNVCQTSGSHIGFSLSMGISKNPTPMRDAWFQYASDRILTVTDDTLITSVWFKV